MGWPEGRGRGLGRAEARGAGRGLRRVSLEALRGPPKPEPTRVRPSPRPPPGAMEQELGGEAAALLRQKRAALRRRGCSFESPRYRGQEGCGWEGRKRGAGHVWGLEVGGNRGLRGRGAGCGRCGGGLGEEPWAKRLGIEGAGPPKRQVWKGVAPEPGERRESRPDETPAERGSYGRPGAELWL